MAPPLPRGNGVEVPRSGSSSKMRRRECCSVSSADASASEERHAKHRLLIKHSTDDGGRGRTMNKNAGFVVQKKKRRRSSSISSVSKSSPRPSSRGSSQGHTSSRRRHHSSSAERRKRRRGESRPVRHSRHSRHYDGHEETKTRRERVSRDDKKPEREESRSHREGDARKRDKSHSRHRTELRRKGGERSLSKHGTDRKRYRERSYSKHGEDDQRKDRHRSPSRGRDRRKGLRDRSSSRRDISHRGDAERSNSRRRGSDRKRERGDSHVRRETERKRDFDTSQSRCDDSQKRNGDRDRSRGRDGDHTRSLNPKGSSHSAVLAEPKDLQKHSPDSRKQPPETVSPSAETTTSTEQSSAASPHSRQGEPTQEKALPAAPALSEKEKRLQRLQRVRKLMEEKKKQQQASVSDEILKLTDETTTDAETSKKTLSEDAPLSTKPVEDIIKDKPFDLSTSDAPTSLNEVGDFAGYLVDSEEPDPLDEFMTGIEAEMQELHFAPKKVKRKRKKQAQQPVPKESAPISISLEEILHLHSQAASQSQPQVTTSEEQSTAAVASESDAPANDLPSSSVSEDRDHRDEIVKESSTVPNAQEGSDVAGPSEEDEEVYYRAFIAEVKRQQAEKAAAEEAKKKKAEEAAAAQARLREEQAKQTAGASAAGDVKEDESSSVPQVSSKSKDELLDNSDDEDYRYNVVEDEALESYFDLVQKVGNRKELPTIDHTQMDYPPFRKNLYIQVREITLMKDHEVDALRKLSGGIRVRGKLCPRPIRTFYQCGLPDPILKIIEKREYEKPFPIQMQALPALMAGRDIIGIAETGSGKTLAYLLPLIRHMLDQPSLKPGDGPIGLVLAPTRELTVQIQREASRFTKVVGLCSIAVYGGTGIGEQLSALKRGAEMVVATPGRLIDVLTINGGKITNLRRVTFAILDEADRMFDMGFEPQITSILKNVRPDAQKAMFSATFPPHIEALARKILRKPLEIVVGERGQTAARIEQFVEVWETPREKFLRLLQLLGEWADHGSIIIFVSRQSDADELFAELLRHGYASLVLHGGQDQTDRDFTIQDFKEGNASILIATSVAARGLDVKSVVLVINYCAPDHLEDYVHRIGRTGRAGNIGVAYTFLMPEDADKADDLIKAMAQSGKEIPEPLQNLADTYKMQCNMGLAKQRGKGGFGGKGFKFTPLEKSRQQQDRIRAKKELGLNESDDEDQTLSSSLDDLENPMSPLPPPTPQGLAPGGGSAAICPVDDVGAASARAKALAELVTRQEDRTRDLRTTIQQKIGAVTAAAAASGASTLAQKSLALAAAAAAAVGSGGGAGGVVPAGVSLASGLSNLSYIDPATGNIVEEFEINDYPQTARFKVTHKDVLNRIADQSGAVLQVKGRYVPPEEKDSLTMLGVKRLYIEIIGSTPIVVQHAKHELRSLLEAVSMKQLNMPSSGRPLGRYSVV